MDDFGNPISISFIGSTCGSWMVIGFEGVCGEALWLTHGNSRR